MIDDLLALLWTYPQVYVDAGLICYAIPRAEFYTYLKRIVEAGFVKRVMFGSDKMNCRVQQKWVLMPLKKLSFYQKTKRGIYFIITLQDFKD